LLKELNDMDNIFFEDKIGVVNKIAEAYWSG
jgi:hypothetical protein